MIIMLKRNKLIAVIFAFVLVGGCKENQPADGKQFKVSGTLTNSKAKKIYLEEIPMASMQRTVVDSSTISGDGKYKLKASASTDLVYTLRLDQNNFPAITIVNDTNSIVVNASFTDAGNEYVDKYEVIGSPASLQFKDFVTGFGNKLMELYNADKKAMDASKKNEQSTPATKDSISRAQLTESLKSFTSTAIDKASNPALAMYILSYYQTTNNQNGYLQLAPINDDEVYELVSKIAAKFPANKTVVSIKEQFEIQKKRQQEQFAQEQQWIGKPAPEIEMQDPSGKTIALSSFKGKYVLVDFWASWCRPCREENPNVVSAFQKFRNKNFTILGVSLDKNKEAWTKAIMKDGLTWAHISDLQEWYSPVVSIYGIQGIPFNVLVDPKGNIIAKNLRGSELHEKLAEVLN
jgi:peroxiredoxin